MGIYSKLKRWMRPRQPFIVSILLLLPTLAIWLYASDVLPPLLPRNHSHPSLPTDTVRREHHSRGFARWHAQSRGQVRPNVSSHGLVSQEVQSRSPGSRNSESHRADTQKAPSHGLARQDVQSRDPDSHEAPNHDLPSHKTPSHDLASHEAPSRGVALQDVQNHGLASYGAPSHGMASRDAGKADGPTDRHPKKHDNPGTDIKGNLTFHINHTPQDRYLIYYCTRGCGGWADRLKGIVTGYVLAGLTGRRFGIRITEPPCPLTQFLIPNKVNWEIGEEEAPSSSGVMVDKMDNTRFLQDLVRVDVSQIFQGRVVLFKANLDYFDKLKSNPRYKEQLRWMQNLTRDQIFSRLFRELFTLSPHVQESLKAVRPASTTARLVCAHLRFANNAGSGLFHDSVKRHTAEHGETVIKFLQTFDPSHASYNATEASAAMTSPVTSADVRFFVTSDSQTFMDKAGKVFGERFVATKGRVMHVDKLGVQQQQQACEAVSKVVVDQQLLSACHVLLISKSGLSRQAAYLRGTDRGLYCVLMDGTVQKCSVSLLKELYQVLG